MLRFRRRTASSLAVAALASICLGPGTPDRAEASPLTPPAVEVAVLSGAARGDTTSLYWVGPGDAKLPASAATLHHRAGAAVRGAVTSTGDVAVVADTAGGDDLSFAATLFIMRRGATPQTLVDRVVHSSRPLPLADGRVVVARGKVGASAGAGLARVDDLTLDAVDPKSGHATTLLSLRGFLLYTAGVVDGAILLYRITETGADLVTVDPATRAETSWLSGMPPFARDFSIDALNHRVVYVDRHPTDSRTWQLLSIDTKTHAQTVLAQSSSLAMMPTALRDGDVAFLSSGRMTRLSKKPFDLPVAGALSASGQITVDGRTWLTGVVQESGKLGVPVLLDGDGHGAMVLAAPSAERVSVAGLRARSDR